MSEMHYQESRGSAPAVTFAEWTQDFELALVDAYDVLKQALPEQSKPFIDAMWLQFRKNPKLQRCTKDSIKAAAIDLSLSGLDITQRGDAWLIPMENAKRGEDGKVVKVEIKDAKGNVKKDKDGRPYTHTVKELQCVVWDGYVGRLKLARNSPGVADAWAEETREHDELIWNGPAELPTHRYDPRKDRGKLDGAYCVVQFDDGRVKALFMNKDEILKHRNQYARAADSDIWQECLYEWRDGKRVTTNTENRGFRHMLKKVVINQLCHPRNITMPRHARNIIEHQEDQIAAHLTPANGESMQPQQPVAATAASMPEIHGESGGPEHQQIFDEISDGYQTVVYPIITSDAGREAVCFAFFGCRHWPDLHRLFLPQLTQRLDRWREFVEALHVEGVPQGSQGWTFAQWREWAWDGVVPETPKDLPETANGGATEAEQQTMWQRTVNESAPDTMKSKDTVPWQLVTIWEQALCGIKGTMASDRRRSLLAFLLEVDEEAIVSPASLSGGDWEKLGPFFEHLCARIEAGDFASVASRPQQFRNMLAKAKSQWLAQHPAEETPA